MKIQFIDAAPMPMTADVAPMVIVVNQDALPADLDPVLVAGARAARFSGKPGQLHDSFVAAAAGVSHLVLLGAGKADDPARSANLERAGAALTATFLTSGIAQLTIDAARSKLNTGETAALLLGARLRGWRHDAYRTKLADDQKPTLTTITVAGAPAGAEAAWASEAALADGVEFTRELVTEPANVIYPESFVARAEAKLAGTGLTLKVLDAAAMTKLGMGALLGVAQGSRREARLLVIEWRGADASVRPTAFVGKGVTFDTGGISLKPPGGMEDMKWDMGGAGAVVGAMLALAKRNAKANIIGLCGLVENMPDGNAQRPGDVVTSMSGQTIEVINTDAEGRLVLCDVLTYVQQEYKPVTIIDLATLTGAMIVALGHEHGGMFANDDTLAADLLSAGAASGDKLWRLPLGAAYDKLIDSPIADMKNVGPREGGSITAAQFLLRYIDKGTPWAHLDIAGMVWASKPGATWDKGATGYGVRVLDQYVRDTLES